MKLVAVAGDVERVIGLDGDGQAWVLIWGPPRHGVSQAVGWERLPMVEVAVDENGNLLDQAAIEGRREAGL